MQIPELLITRDGSHTLQLSQTEVTYHSRHGAIQESHHVFIQAGMLHYGPKQGRLTIFEMGFGTGLNAWLTCKQATQWQLPVTYYTLEAYPIPVTLAAQLNYPAAESWDAAQFLSLHQAPFNTSLPITPFFTLHKIQGRLENTVIPTGMDVIYYDAFAPETQPELWTEAIFGQLLQITSPGGCLTTYCSKGAVRRAMQAAGWQVTKIPGPPGKREMVRAYCPIAPMP